MPFNPKPEYIISEQLYSIKEFFDYVDDFITRPPYQRKNVWSKKKKQSLLDSLFRRYYIPKIVIREVRLDEDRSVSEIIDGQQRIITVQEFFDNKIKLPKTLEDINPDLSNKYFKDLSPELRRFIDKELKYDADIVKGIDDPSNVKHQEIATEIFWRLQQGESLNFMEIAHARLSSLTRNFVVKYADDITFDFDSYKPIEKNPNKHKFFSIINKDNNRMQHLLLLTRFLLLEKANGPTELKDLAVTQIIEDYKKPNGVGNYSFEDENVAKDVLSIMYTFYEIFKDDPMIDKNSKIKELSREYVIISLFLLIRHIKKYYILDDKIKLAIYDFFIKDFYLRWADQDDEDKDVLLFSSNRQMDQNSIEERDQILRQLFFDYIDKKGINIKAKDEKRIYNEAEKIKIYRRDKGLCQVCIAKGKKDKEAQVSWSQFEADHILAHSKGGETKIENAQVLCRHHNRKKSAS